MEYQPDRPSMRALSIGASTVLMSVWPVLKSLPADGHALVRGELAQRRDVDSQRFGAPLAKGMPSSMAA